ncbi:RAB17, member RAS oncogene family, isoform CRA_b [Mus musculus]|nr:RAB17, member RAS oncogene family, isoform CRA_b [Mus musculus]
MAQAAGLPQASTASGQPYVSKLVLLGSSSVGKTSLALRYMKQDFSNVLPTVGCNLYLHKGGGLGLLISEG